MENYQWQPNQSLAQVEIPEQFKDDVLAYAQRLDKGEDSYIAQVKQALEGQLHNYANSDFITQKNHLLEQYKIYIEMADRISSRRLQTNGFFITLFSGLLAVIAFIFNKDTSLVPSLQVLLLWGVAFFGLFLSLIWMKALESYKILNSGKFKVINAIETLLPCPGYSEEWKIVKQQGYERATRIENWLAWVFFGFWTVLIIYLFGQIPALSSIINSVCKSATNL
jgi:hypothetical protein